MSHPNPERDERAKSAHDLAVEWSQSTEEGSIIATADIDRLAAVIDRAATRMRKACVGKVKEHLHARLSEEMQSLCGHNSTIQEVVTALESLTPDQVEQEKSK